MYRNAKSGDAFSLTLRNDRGSEILIMWLAISNDNQHFGGTRSPAVSRPETLLTEERGQKKRSFLKFWFYHDLQTT